MITRILADAGIGAAILIGWAAVGLPFAIIIGRAFRHRDQAAAAGDDPPAAGDAIDSMISVVREPRPGVIRRGPQPDRHQFSAGHAAHLLTLAAQSGWLPPNAHRNGQQLADRLRLGIPGLTDAHLAAVTLTHLAYAAECEHATQGEFEEDLGAAFALWASAASCAALQLTSIDRTDVPR